LGHGSLFEIYIPACKKEPKMEKESPAELQKGNETVLLVDDEDLIADVGNQMLKKLGYEVLLARGGEEATEVYKQNQDRIDMVILDMIMPDMSGGETYLKLKQINPEIKVLLSSGYSLNTQASEILKQGCDGFIQKPFDLEELSQRIREILAQNY
jgi:two-component system cell cycle sensor histidine kinase/response regulator CckA